VHTRLVRLLRFSQKRQEEKKKKVDSVTSVEKTIKVVTSAKWERRNEAEEKNGSSEIWGGGNDNMDNKSIK